MKRWWLTELTDPKRSLPTSTDLFSKEPKNLWNICVQSQTTEYLHKFWYDSSWKQSPNWIKKHIIPTVTSVLFHLDYISCIVTYISCWSFSLVTFLSVEKVRETEVYIFYQTTFHKIHKKKVSPHYAWHNVAHTKTCSENICHIYHTDIRSPFLMCWAFRDHSLNRSECHWNLLQC